MRWSAPRSYDRTYRDSAAVVKPGGGGAIEERDRLAVRGAEQTRRRRGVGRRLRTRAHRLRLRLAERRGRRRAAPREHRQRHRHALDRRSCGAGDRAALALLERGRAREERRRVPVRAESLEREPERARRRARRSYSAAAASPPSSPRMRCTSAGSALEPVEKRLAGEQVVRALVVRRHAALVAPPEPRPAPVRLERRGVLVTRGRGVPPPESAMCSPARAAATRSSAAARLRLS